MEKALFNSNCKKSDKRRRNTRRTRLQCSGWLRTWRTESCSSSVWGEACLKIYFFIASYVKVTVVHVIPFPEPLIRIWNIVQNHNLTPCLDWICLFCSICFLLMQQYLLEDQSACQQQQPGQFSTKPIAWKLLDHRSESGGTPNNKNDKMIWQIDSWCKSCSTDKVDWTSDCRL